MFKSNADIIERVRRHTLNTGETSTAGIPDSHFIDYLQDAQNEVERQLLDINPGIFERQTTTNLVAGQRAYDLPADIALRNRVSLVEYSSTGQNDDYHPIRMVPFRNLDVVEVNHPRKCAILKDQVFISPVPSSAQGTLRFTYQRRLDAIDIVRATISSHTDSGTQITALTLDTSDDDVTALDAGSYLTVNDRDGNVTMYNIRYDSYDDATGVVTLTGSAFTYATGETIANGDFVCTTPYGTTHSDLEDLAEDALVYSMIEKVLSFEDSSADFAQATEKKLQALESLINAYTPIGDDIDHPLWDSPYFR